MLKASRALSRDAMIGVFSSCNVIEKLEEAPAGCQAPRPAPVWKDSPEASPGCRIRPFRAGTLAIDKENHPCHSTPG